MGPWDIQALTHQSLRDSHIHKKDQALCFTRVPLCTVQHGLSASVHGAVLEHLDFPRPWNCRGEVIFLDLL